MAVRWAECDAKKSEKESEIEVRTTKTIETQRRKPECGGQTVMRPGGKFNFVAQPYAHLLSTYYYLLVKSLEMFYLPILDGGRVSGRSVPNHVEKASQFAQCFV